MPFIPDPAALTHGTKLLRELHMRVNLGMGIIRLPRVRVVYHDRIPNFKVRKNKRRVFVPIRRNHITWAKRQTMKRNFSRKIRDIIYMLAGVRAHVNLTMWRVNNHPFNFEGHCDDCGMTFRIKPAFWAVFPRGLLFRGMAFVDDCTRPQPVVRKVVTRTPYQPFSKLLRVPKLL